ncbi:MAG TPA: hypothetical protein VMP01_18300 [Pirellulaceae bacterium]|nr:hypothetical protein [Pirellulaceae bacterium]
MGGLSSPSPRPVALGLLLAANALIASAMPWMGFFLSWAGFGQRSFFIGPGIWLGQGVWMACWFSLSQHSLRYRVLASLSALGVANLAIAFYACQFAIFYYRFYHGWSQIDIPWMAGWSDFFRNGLVCLALLTGIYAILLPVRRMRGIELGIRRTAADEAARTGQFRISEWMIWTVLAVLPLAIIRWLMRDDLFAPLVVFLVIIAVGMLLLGMPAFFASAIRSYWPIGIAVSFTYVLGVLWFYSSGADLLGLSWGGPVVDLRVVLYVAMPALAALYANNLILQALGIGLVVVPPPTREAARGR